MPATPKYALPYPAATDTADVPRDVQALATRLEVVIPRPMARVSKGALAGLAGGSAIGPLTWTLDVDDGGYWNPAQTSRLTPPAAGWYEVGIAAMIGTANADAYLTMRLENPTVYLPIGAVNRAPSTVGVGWVGAASGPVLFAAGQWLNAYIGVWGPPAFDLTAAIMWIEKLR